MVAGTKPSANFHSTGWKTAAQRVTVLKQVASGYRSLRSFRVYTSVSPTLRICVFRDTHTMARD